ncbi:MAG: SDR family oxidoreductase [Anaerolineae bacterium]|nr:SDR family oxidoreductase [Anaerolineae bacterium]
MSSRHSPPRIFVAGATGFVGNAVIFALLEAGAHVTALVPHGRALQINRDRKQLRIVEGNAWNLGSLIGRSRNHRAVIHLVGSVKENPERGQSYHHTNVDSLQNITRMAIGDGVPLLVYLSTSHAIWLPGSYKRSKREAEYYLQRSGMRYTILRAPLIYPRGKLQNPLLIMTSIAGGIPLLGRPFSRWAPLPVDVLARGVAEVALAQEWPNQILFRRQLHKLSRQYMTRLLPQNEQPSAASLAEIEDDMPFGWLP